MYSIIYIIIFIILIYQTSMQQNIVYNCLCTHIFISILYCKLRGKLKYNILNIMPYILYLE